MNTTTHSRHSRSGTTYKKRRVFRSGAQNSNKSYGKRQERGRAISGGRSRFGGRGGSGGGKRMPTFNPSKFINTNPVDVSPEIYTPKHTFGDFGLDNRIVKATADLGMKIPSPIQDQSIPEILKGRDIVGLAETGTGKTAAFLVPLIDKTLRDNKRQTLVLAPTRELAIQIEEELKTLSKNSRLFSVTCVGGINIRPQIRALHRRNHFIIGTPGRILDLIKRKSLNTSGITTVVLDEADRMLDMGFINDMKKILSTIRKDRETLLFSATMSRDMEGIVKDFLKDPITVSVKKKDVTNSIMQDVVHFNHSTKFEKLLELLKKPEFKRVLVFGSMKHSVEKLSQQLSQNNIKAESIHGNKGHGQRIRALSKFKAGGAQVLVATDVAARGIHIDEITHVINYDMPNTFEDYVHRIGRTGRGSKKGKALTFIPEKPLR